jgi:23S rRNA pseudouridine1911/1915/1917 synthase
MTTPHDSEQYVVPATLDGARLDKATAALATGLSVARVKRAIDGGHVRVDGRRRAKGAPVATGETITIARGEISAPDAPCTPEPDAPLVLRFESDTVIVADKRAGQATAPLRAGELGALANALVGRFPELAGIGYGPREPGILHRLDIGTSGVVVVARTAAAWGTLREALKSGRLVKRYGVVCESDGLPDEGTIAHPIANHPKDQRRVIACIHPRDVTRYSPRGDDAISCASPWRAVRARRGISGKGASPSNSRSLRRDRSSARR